MSKSDKRTKTGGGAGKSKREKSRTASIDGASSHHEATRTTEKTTHKQQQQIQQQQKQMSNSSIIARSIRSGGATHMPGARVNFAPDPFDPFAAAPTLSQANLGSRARTTMATANPGGATTPTLTATDCHSTVALTAGGHPVTTPHVRARGKRPARAVNKAMATTSAKLSPHQTPHSTGGIVPDEELELSDDGFALPEPAATATIPKKVGKKRTRERRNSADEEEVSEDEKRRPSKASRKKKDTAAVDENTYQSADTLLAQADQYYRKLNREERKLNQEASKKLSEMKRINAKGGTKDGFKFVLPKNVKSMVRRMQADRANAQVANATSNADVVPSVDTDSLANHFGGDGEEDNRPMKRHKRNAQKRDDFYAFQVYKKWTKNAENFLARGRASNKLFKNRKATKKL